MELGRVTKQRGKYKRKIRRWRLDRFPGDDVKARYCEALKAEVESFSGSIEAKVKRGVRGGELVGKVLDEWENIVNRVVKAEVGEKVMVCGRSVRWWDDEIKEKIQKRREVYKRIVRTCGRSTICYAERLKILWLRKNLRCGMRW